MPQVAFLPAADSPTEPLFIANRTLDLIFCVDLALNFFIMQPVSDPDLGTRWIDDHRKVIR